MKIEITEEGNLKIDRKDVMKKQFCPFKKEKYLVNMCGDHCPLFGEPENFPFHDTKSEKAVEGILITLCHEKQFVVKKLDFTDNRKRGTRYELF